MPRLTSIPEESSLAMRRAMMVWGSMRSSHIGNEVVDQWRRSHHMIGRHHTDWHDIISANDNGATRHRDHWIELARGQRIAQVSEIVGEERLNKREISMKCGFNEVASS